MAARAAEEIVLDDRDSDLQDDETGSFQSAVNSSGDGDKDISQNDSFHSNNLTTTPISTNTARRVKGSKKGSMGDVGAGEGGFMLEEDSSGRVTDDGEGSFDSQEETDESEDDSRDEVLVPATPDPSDRPCSAELSTPRLGGTPDDNLLKEMAAISLKSSATAEAFSTNRQIEIIDVTANSELGNDNLHHVIDQHPMKHIEVIQLQDTPVPAKPPSLSSVITISSPEWMPVPVRSLFSSVSALEKKGSLATFLPEPQHDIPKPKTFAFKQSQASVLSITNPDPLLIPSSTMNSSKAMATSTPLMSNNRRKISNVFDDLDVTGIPVIEEEVDVVFNVDANSKSNTDTATSLRSPNKSLYSGASSASGGYRDTQEDSDIEIVHDDDDDEAIIEVGRLSEPMSNTGPGKKILDIDEITSRLKKQHIQRKPLIQYLDNLPDDLATGGSNPFSTVSKPPRAKANHMSMNMIIESKSDVFKSAKLLVEIIDAMPMPEDDNSDFVPPKQLTVKLYPHQLYGAKWMCWRESVYPGGGILADDMGLGKTIMAITLIVSGLQSPRGDRENWYSPENKKLVHSRATLVVCPKGCISQWETELKTKAKRLNILVYHGPNRTNSAAILAQNDVVLTTYPTLSSEIPKPDDDPANRCRSPLLRIQWERIMLDEGHTIRNPRTHCALSACRLNAYHRWVMTGTPVHNSPEDFYSLIRFLDFQPFADPQVWVHWIGKKQVLKGCEKRLHLIGKALLLRRTKEEVSAATEEIDRLPPKHVEDVEVTLSESEEPVYTYMFDYAKSLMTKFLDQQQDRKEEMQNAANNYVAGAMKRGKKKKDNDDDGEMRFSTILTLITRLRQLAVLPYLVKTMLEDDEAGSDDENSYDPLQDPINAQNPVFEIGFKSSKIKAVLQQLKQLKEEAHSKGEMMDKVIIVSSWTSFLDIMAQHLTKRGYSNISLDGRLDVSERSEIMRKFNENPQKPQIMLLSINAGGVGLNLTGANHVFFIEPQWNPQIERQAQDRVHRYGQTKPVFIKRFIAKSSFEQRVMEIQLGKLELADDLLTNSKKSRGAGLNVNDLKKLFDLS